MHGSGNFSEIEIEGDDDPAIACRPFENLPIRQIAATGVQRMNRIVPLDA